MMAQKRALLPILLILAALSGAVYMMTAGGGDGRREPAAEITPSAPDISLDGIRHTFIENGSKKWTLRAASAHLSRAGRQTRVNDILLTFFSDDGRPFRVTADSGLLSHDTGNAVISGNVIIDHQDGKIHTGSLHYLTQDHIITSDERVRVIGELLHLEGDHLRYDLRSMTAELTGNVNGIINENLTRR